VTGFLETTVELHLKMTLFDFRNDIEIVVYNFPWQSALETSWRHNQLSAAYLRVCIYGGKVSWA